MRSGSVTNGRRFRVRLRGLVVGEHANAQDAAAAGTVDPQGHAVAGVDLFALARQAPEQADGITADRFELFVRKRDAQRGVDVFDVRAGFDDRLALGDRADRFFFAFIVFVADLADDLFEQIFHRHETRGAAVFVEHDGERELPTLHLAEQLRDALVLWDVHDRPHQRAQRRV